MAIIYDHRGRPIDTERDYAAGAQAYTDIAPDGPLSHDLPHAYLPQTGNDRHYVSGQGFVDDDGTCCQFTAGRSRCQGTRADHEHIFPKFNPRSSRAQSSRRRPGGDGG